MEIRNSGKRFDLVTINYVLSVADNPGEILDCIKNVLSERGVLFIIDTDFEIQPYTLNIVEVSSFITKKSLSNILIKKGYAEFFPEFVHDKKEIWAFAMVNEQREYKEQNLYEENCRIYKRKIGYLNNVVDVVEKYYMLYDKLAIFGMSNAGIWVLEIIEKLGKGKKQITWIEEDEEILQKGYGVNGYSISKIEKLDFNTVVFLPFPDYVSRDIMRRYCKYSPKIHFISFDD